MRIYVSFVCFTHQTNHFNVRMRRKWLSLKHTATKSVHTAWANCRRLWSISDDLLQKYNHI